MDRKENLKNYISKINCFVTCIRSNKWVKGAEQEDICMLFEIANDIEMTVKKFKSSKFDEKLRKLHPSIDLSRSSDLLLEGILKCPSADDSIVVESIKQFLKYHPDNRLSQCLGRFLTEKKLKDNLILLNQDGVKSKLNLKTLEAKSIFLLWEELLLLNNGNLKKIIIELLNNKPLYLLSIIDLSPETEKDEKIEIIVNHLNTRKNLQTWFKLLTDKNLDKVVDLCDKHGLMLECVLNFFELVENEIEEDYDEEFNVKWKHKDLGFDDFVNIVRRFFEKEGDVRRKVDEFLIRKRNDFDCNFLFWAEVSSCVY